MTSPAPAPATTSLDGTLERVVYQSPDDAWSVVKLTPAGGGAMVTAVGKLLGVQPGESLRLEGTWEENDKFGRQFKVAAYRQVAPATVLGIERYLGSGLIRGIGKRMAKRLVEAFGMETLEVIERHPERLAEVPGIGPKRRADILGAWAEQREIKEVMVFLQSHGVATSHAIRIYKTYGGAALSIVRSDPYRLATDVFGIGFKSADQIAASIGLPADSPERVRAGLLYTLEQAAEHGHVHLPKRELFEQTAALLGVEEARLVEALPRLVAEGQVVVEPRGAEGAAGETSAAADPASGGGDAVFLRLLHAAEEGLAKALLQIARRPGKPLAIDVERALAWFEERESIELAAQQREAIRRGIASQVLVVTGGPGTGKTTLIRGIVAILQAKRQRVLLAAPTGRAAKRLSEATGREARTVHRLLEFDPVSRGFLRGPERPLPAEVVIVDESSMLDVSLAHHVARAVPEGGRLILVGDVDQLPSVGPGRVLAELIDSGAVDVVRLTEIYRQAVASRIVVNAHRVNRGEMPILAGAEAAGGDFFYLDRRTPEEVLDTVLHLVAERIPAGFGFDPLADVQVLTPMNRGLLGTASLNEHLRQRLNPPRPGTLEMARGGRLFRVGDKVMQMRNNYDLEVFNGDLGRVVGIDGEEQEMVVDFDGRAVAYDVSLLDELVPAFACSIHKSQGSEYPCVVVPLHSQHYVMLERNLLYTALTRARKLVVIVGEPRALAVAVGNRRTRERYTRLAERLRAG